MKSYHTILEISSRVAKMDEREFTDELAWPTALKFARKIVADFARPRSQVVDIAHTIRVDLVDAWKDGKFWKYGKFDRRSTWNRLPFSWFRRSYYAKVEVLADDKTGPHIPLINTFNSLKEVH